MSTDDRIKAPLAAFIRHITADYAFSAAYPARVVAQHADGTLDVQPDDTRLPGLTRLPMRYGLPGVKATVAPGARCAIEFENGNQGRPVVTLWESGSVTRLEITAGEVVINGGTQKVAREGDSVRVTIPTGTTLGANTGGNLTTAAPITLNGTITAGAAHVKA